MRRTARPTGPDGAPRRASAGTEGPGLLRSLDRWQLSTAAGLAVVAVALVALLVLHDQRYAPEVRDSMDAALRLDASLEAMLDQQSGLRAFAMTGDEQFLATARAARGRLADLDDRDLPGGDAANRLLVDERVARAGWNERWAHQAMAAGAAGGASGAEIEQLLLDGRALFDRYRTAHRALVAEVIDQRDAAMDQQRRAVTTTALVALAVAAATGVGSVWRGRRTRRRAEAALADITLRLDRLEAGDLGPAPPPSGPAELAEIQAGIDDAVGALARARADVQAKEGTLMLHNAQLGHVLRFAREVAGSLNLRYVIRGLCSATANITGSSRVVVWLRREEGEQVLDAIADSAGPALEPIGLDPVLIGEGTVGRAARFGRMEGAVARADRADGGVAADGDDDSLAVPMVVGAEVIGVLEVRMDGDVAPSTWDVLEALAIQAATAVGAARVHEHTETLAMTDALTAMPNRRRMEADLAREVGVSARYGRPLGFAMLDVDHFKAYNDTLGHQAADVALQSLARVLTASVRAGDTVYRYGGEELAVIMREADLAASHQMAERLREIVSHHFAAPGQPRPVTVSVGVAAMPEHGTSATELVGAADEALYEAKRTGRNRTVAAPLPEEGPR